MPKRSDGTKEKHMEKNCIACGMPMRSPGDFAMGDESRDYCRHCAREDGSMQSYDEKLESMTKFVMESEGLPEEEAGIVATKHLAGLPAWKDMPRE
jgi:hypothetical protein